MKKFKDIFTLGVVFGWREETAYVFNNWANILSTLFYNITFYFFIRILFYNVDSIAGYTLDESILLMIVAQFVFYISYSVYLSNTQSLSVYINTGFLDFLLVRPMPALTYIMFHKIKIFSMVRDGFIPIGIIFTTINFSNIEVSLESFLFALVIFILGNISNMFVGVLFVLPAFWFEKSEALIRLNDYLVWFSRREIPYEGFPNIIRSFFTYIMPTFIVSLLTTSVLLSKSDPVIGVAKALISTIIFSTVVYLLWRLALKRYSSASS